MDSRRDYRYHGTRHWIYWISKQGLKGWELYKFNKEPTVTAKDPYDWVYYFRKSITKKSNK
jgi:hypothetical protein